MSRIAAVIAGALVAACSGNPLTGIAPPTDPDAPGGSGDLTVPEELAGNLSGATYDPAAQTLTVSLQALDGGETDQAYVRDPSLDLNGFEAYTLQETGTQRKFVALFRESPSGAVQAGTISDGGQFVNVFRGGTFARVDAFTLPSSGLATYTGGYVGLTNAGVTQPGPAGPPFDPAQATRVTGDVLINADFADASVNGGIRNRTVIETGEEFDDVFLEVTGIDADGAFEGRAMRDPQTQMGDYAGIFGGEEASDIAGLIFVTPVEGEPNLIESGAFTAARCAPGAGAPCP